MESENGDATVKNTKESEESPATVLNIKMPCQCKGPTNPPSSLTIYSHGTKI